MLFNRDVEQVLATKRFNSGTCTSGPAFFLADDANVFSENQSADYICYMTYTFESNFSNEIMLVIIFMIKSPH